MNSLTRTIVPPVFNRYVALTSLQQLTPGMRLDFDADTYVIRSDDRYITYRTWLSRFPLVEVFNIDDESGVIRWFERFGYSFD